MDDIRILIGNFNSEDLWSDGKEATIERPDFLGIRSVINNLDELFLYLAREQDIVILRRKPNSEFLNYLKELGVVLPHFYVVKEGDSTKTLGELILNDTELMERLKTKAVKSKIQGYELPVIPYSITGCEEKIAAQIGGRIGSPAHLPKLFNNKEYARKLLKSYEINMPFGHACKDMQEFKTVSHAMLSDYGSIIIKELIGSGGTKLYIIRSEEQLAKLCRIYDREENRQKSILVERYYPSRESYNYQYMLRGGKAIPYAFSRQLLLNGKIMGSYFSHVYTRENELVRMHFNLSLPIARHIAESGYNGIVGFDSIVCEDGTLFPIVDINCRINLSTIFHGIRNNYFKSKYAQFYCIELKKKSLMDFETIRKEYLSDPYNMERKEGMVILNTNSLFNNVSDGIIKVGRFYIGLFYNTIDGLQKNFQDLKGKLKATGGENR